MGPARRVQSTGAGTGDRTGLKSLVETGQPLPPLWCHRRRQGGAQASTLLRDVIPHSPEGVFPRRCVFATGLVWRSTRRAQYRFAHEGVNAITVGRAIPLHEGGVLQPGQDLVQFDGT